MTSRSHYSPLASWWRTVDRLMLAALLAVMLAGIVLSLAASPPVAARLGTSIRSTSSIVTSCI